MLRIASANVLLIFAAFVLPGSSADAWARSEPVRFQNVDVTLAGTLEPTGKTVSWFSASIVRRAHVHRAMALEREGHEVRAINLLDYGQKNALGGQQVSYDATTGKGRHFTCTVFMIPGLTPIDKPTYNDWECHPHR